MLDLEEFLMLRDLFNQYLSLSEIARERIEQILQENGRMTVNELAEALDERPENIRRSLVDLGDKVGKEHIGREWYWYLNTSEAGARETLAELKADVEMRKAARLEEIGERVLRVLRQGEGMSWREMRNAGLKGYDKDIRRVIGSLVDRGLVLSEKSGRVTKHRLA